MSSLSVIYVTANREDEAFERKIQERLLEVSGDHPVISVSQKPVDVGVNVCLGDIGYSYRHAHVQILVGALTAETEWVAIAESDQLYPPGYFDFEPDPDPAGPDVYMFEGLWILRHWDPEHFRAKEWGGWTTISRRKFLIDRLCFQLGRHRTHTLGEIFKKKTWERFAVGLPMVSVKTPANLSRTTGTILGSDVKELPHWGKAIDLSMSLGLA